MTSYQKQHYLQQRQAKAKAIAITATQSNNLTLQIAAIAAMLGFLMTML